MWNHVAYNNFTTHEKRSGIAYSCSIVCTALNGVVMSFKNPTTFSMLSPNCKKTYRMGYLCIRVAFAFHAFPVIGRDADFLFATGKLFRFTATLFSCTVRNRRALCVRCNVWKVMLSNCQIELLVFHSKARNDHLIPLDNNDIMNCGMMQKKKGYVFDDKKRKTCQYYNDVKTLKGKLYTYIIRMIRNRAKPTPFFLKKVKT